MNDLDFIKKFHFNQLNPQETEAFDKRLQEDADFAKTYTDFMIDESLMKDAIHELSINGNEPHQARKSKNSFYLIASAIMATAALFAFFLQSPSQKNIDFNPKIISVKSKQNFQAGQILELGRFYKTFKGEKLRVQYPDKSILEFTNEAEFSFNRKLDSKLVYLNHGQMYGDIQKQELGPMLIETGSAKAEILGTKFNLISEPEKSYLEVLHGRIRFQNRTGNSDIVQTGEKASASPKQAVIAESIHPNQVDEDFERYSQWQNYSNQLQKDPDLVAYYDHFKGEFPYVLKNLSQTDSPHLRDGRITDPQWTKGRWPQKDALYYSTYSYVDCGSDSHFNFEKAVTLFAWVKVKKFTRYFQTIVARGDHSWRIARNGNENSIEFACGTNKPYVVRGKKSIDDNQWHLVTATYDGQVMKLYIDGQIDAVHHVKGQIKVTPNKRVDIGTNNDRSHHRDFEGWMDEVGIFKRALSTAEVQEMYDIGKP
ncbi:FecR domain-containing protein [Lentisphaera marina]|uniref:LamG-like jellyroll fold domain-containing protein n=1 Tax=Lentisphaera marina TaxID=1111041 RepID=UPI002365BA5B|nr:LamG-like jellyroll fold domain-containing protein [Lentisphaera marina]MDD7987309.1 FecR domain-containing protein [Lentisphaera marina]